MMITGEKNIKMAQMLVQKSALALEIQGLRHSRGSVYALIKKTYGLKGSKQKVYEQFLKIIEEEGKK